MPGLEVRLEVDPGGAGSAGRLTSCPSVSLRFLIQRAEVPCPTPHQTYLRRRESSHDRDRCAAMETLNTAALSPSKPQSQKNPGSMLSGDVLLGVGG